MIETGLLWYDDDSRRRVAVKIAEAAQRYRERVGLEPTTCQLNPAQAPTPAAEQPRRKRKDAQAALSIGLRLVPPATPRPNSFFVGIEEGQPATPVRCCPPPHPERPTPLSPHRPPGSRRARHPLLGYSRLPPPRAGRSLCQRWRRRSCLLARRRTKRRWRLRKLHTPRRVHAWRPPRGKGQRPRKR